MDRLLNLFKKKNYGFYAETSVEPPACWGAFSTEAGGLHYSWRGVGPGENTTTIAIYSPTKEEWTLQPTTGSSPPGLWGGGCASIANNLHCFGGLDQCSYVNDLYKLNLETFQWSNIPFDNPHPFNKKGCGLVSMDERFLVCFGGYGIGPTQPGSTFSQNTSCYDKSGWTNEFHLFDVQEGVWASPSIKGERPPPCDYFSFTKVDRDTVILFGGFQPGHGGVVNDLYIFNLKKMEVTKVKPVEGEPWPEERSSHAACCLNYNFSSPKLLVSGGVGKDLKVLGDMWILDVDTGKWTEITPPESVKARYNHSVTASNLGPGLTEVLVFGGCLMWGGSPIAETTILRFGCSLSMTGPPTEKWVLVDMAHNQTRGSQERLKEKREKIRQATHRSSPQAQRMRSLEQQLQAAKQRIQDAEQRAVDAERIVEELFSQITRNQNQITQLQGDLQKTQRKAQLDLDNVLCQKEDIERELEGKTKELAAHNTEVWRIPSSKVNTTRTIGTGGWGEVLEGTVRVAIKRLHIAILNTRNLERLQREMKLLAEVRHPNLVQFIGAVFDQSPPLIVTELLEINLRQAYEQNQLGPGDRLSIFIDIARALDYLHQRYEPIIHRDVSAPNVLLQRMPNNQWKGKVSDLGSANFLQSAQTMGEGAIVYSPPEVIPQPFALDSEPPPQTVKIDVYSYGIVVCEVTASRFPSQESYREMFQQVQREHPQVYELIVECTRREPSDRPSMAELIVRLRNMRPF